MDTKQFEYAKQVLQKHYKKVLQGRKITNEEIYAEIANLKRKKDAGTICDLALNLYSKLTTGIHAVSI